MQPYLIHETREDADNIPGKYNSDALYTSKQTLLLARGMSRKVQRRYVKRTKIVRKVEAPPMAMTGRRRVKHPDIIVLD